VGDLGQLQVGHLLALWLIVGKSFAPLRAEMKDITTGGINIEIARKENFQGTLSICYKAKLFQDGRHLLF